MIALLAALTSGPLAPPPPELIGPFQDAIWYDLELNAMIGNGNWIASLWYNAGIDNSVPRELRILDLACQSLDGGYECSFLLVRDGGPGMAFGEVAPDRLNCTARLAMTRSEGEAGWRVSHISPRGAGHSRTSMACEQA